MSRRGQTLPVHGGLLFVFDTAGQVVLASRSAPIPWHLDAPKDAQLVQCQPSALHGPAGSYFSKLAPF